MSECDILPREMLDSVGTESWAFTTPSSPLPKREIVAHVEIGDHREKR